MKNLHVYLNENNCKIFKKGRLLWSTEINFYNCQDKLLNILTKEKSPISLILDHFWLKKFNYHIEDTSFDSAQGLICAQAANYARLPEEMISCQIIDIITNIDSIQGSLIFADKNELAKLENSFTRKKIIIDKIYTEEFPQLLFHNRKEILKTKQAQQKKIFSVSFAVLLTIIISSFCNASLAHKLKIYPQIKIQYLKLIKENDHLKTKQKYQIKFDQIINKANKQKVFLQKFFKGFPKAITPGIQPTKINLDLKDLNMQIYGYSQNINKCNKFVENLLKQPYFKKVFLESFNNSNSRMSFQLSAQL